MRSIPPLSPRDGGYPDNRDGCQLRNCSEATSTFSPPHPALSHQAHWYLHNCVIPTSEGDSHLLQARSASFEVALLRRIVVISALNTSTKR